jgi:hypothetical protein
MSCIKTSVVLSQAEQIYCELRYRGSKYVQYIYQHKIVIYRWHYTSVK